MVQRNAVRAAQRAAQRTPMVFLRSIVLAIVGGFVAGLLIFGIDFFLGFFAGIGDVAVAVVSGFVALFVFLWATGVARGRFRLVDIFPIFLVSSAATGILTALNFTVPAVGLPTQLGADFALVFASIVLTNSFLMRQFRAFR